MKRFFTRSRIIEIIIVVVLLAVMLYIRFGTSVSELDEGAEGYKYSTEWISTTDKYILVCVLALILGSGAYFIYDYRRRKKSFLEKTDAVPDDKKDNDDEASAD